MSFDLEAVDIRLIAVDLDGTLLTRDHMPAPEGARALAEAVRCGVHVILSTTRTPPSVVEFAHAMGLVQPLICTNGAQIYASPGGDAWVTRGIAPDLAYALAHKADAEGWSLVTTVGTTTYYRRQPGQSLSDAGDHRRVVPTNVDALSYNGEVVRILNYEAAAIPVLRRLCVDRFPDAYHLETYYYPDERVKSIGIFTPGSDKGTALRLVMKRLGVPTPHVMAIGDNPNDLPMFSLAGLCVAMGNAVQAVKAKAHIVAPTNDEDGVAWAVRRYVLARTPPTHI
jgi:hypothetical protein